jgi:uncharacterized metal-binding protein
MSDTGTCCGDGVKTLVVACSGGSNVGQISNSVMIEMDKEGIGSAYCLAGLGAALSGFVESSKAAQVILIDGCPVSCGKKILESHGIQPSRYFVVSDLGIEKKHAFEKLAEETKAALDQILCNI